MRRFFFPPIETVGQDGILLEVRPQDHHPWIGQFAFGHFGTGASAVLACPKPDEFAVMADGAAYVVNVTLPEKWKRIEVQPVRQVKLLRCLGLFLFADFTRIVAYGREGLAWISGRLCWDDLEIVTGENGTVHGVGYDPADAETPTKNFSISIQTGKVIETEFTNLG